MSGPIVRRLFRLRRRVLLGQEFLANSIQIADVRHHRRQFVPTQLVPKRRHLAMSIGDYLPDVWCFQATRGEPGCATGRALHTMTISARTGGREDFGSARDNVLLRQRNGW
jgi:hypothetical protein